MKIIAKRDFRNTGQVLNVEGQIHPDHIHKGATFVVGADEKTPYEKLNQADKLFIGQLNAADCIADGSDPKIVKQVMDEVAADKKAKAAAEPARK